MKKSTLSIALAASLAIFAQNSQAMSTLSCFMGASFAAGNDAPPTSDVEFPINLQEPEFDEYVCEGVDECIALSSTPKFQDRSFFCSGENWSECIFPAGWIKTIDLEGTSYKGKLEITISEPEVTKNSTTSGSLRIDLAISDFVNADEPEELSAAGTQTSFFDYNVDIGFSLDTSASTEGVYFSCNGY